MTPHQTFINSLITNINEQLSFIEKFILKLNRSTFWHQPNQYSNSVVVICQHLCGNLIQYVLSGLTGTKDERKRDEEFLNSMDKTPEESIEELKSVISKVNEVILKLEVGNLGESHFRQGKKISSLEILLHVSHHLANHTGQINYITKLVTQTQTNLFRARNLNLLNA